MEINKIYNESNLETMKKMESGFLDGVITSPPYNISLKRKDAYYDTGYSDIDNLSENDFLELRTSEFKELSRILKQNGTICYNISYISNNPILPNLLVTKVHQETDLTLADILYWKKSVAMPFQSSATNLSRVVEPFYIFVHKNSLKTFTTNKEVSKINPKTGQKFFKHYPNIVEAQNNNRFKTNLKAVYSIEIVKKVIDIYFPKGSLIYDPFMGSGTTAMACIQTDRNYIGSEIKEEFFNDSQKRINSNG